MSTTQALIDSSGDRVRRRRGAYPDATVGGYYKLSNTHITRLASMKNFTSDAGMAEKDGYSGYRLQDKLSRPLRICFFASLGVQTGICLSAARSLGNSR